MDKNINYKKIFKNIVGHKDGKSFMIDFGGDQASVSIFAYGKVLKELGIDRVPRINSLVQLSSKPEEEFLDKYNIGIRWLYPGASEKTRDLYETYRDVLDIDVKSEIDKGYISGGSGKFFYDEWGVKWKRSAYYFEMVEHPLQGKDLEFIKKYPFPDPSDRGRVAGLKDELDQYNKENQHHVYSLSQSYGGLLEAALWLRGFSDFYMDIASNNKECSFLLDKLKEYFIEWNRSYLDEVEGKIHIMAIGDDYGMQDRTLMDPDVWRRHIKTRYKEMIETAKGKYSHIKWFHHSCGAIYPVIKDLIEIGVDILNPIQPLAKGMEPVRLKQEFGKMLTFHGGIDIQNLLLFSTPKKIREEVKRVIDILSKDGGFIIAPAHNIQANTPVENILAFYETANDYFLKYNNLKS